MELFFTHPNTVDGEVLHLTGEELHHASRVLRKKPGDELSVTDGAGNLYETKILTCTEVEAVCRIIERKMNFNELTREVVLVQAVLKNPGKMDWIVEKATELGVRSIIPITTARTLAAHAKTDRFQRLALAAMKQSLRSFLPVIGEMTSFIEAVRKFKSGEILLFHEAAESSDFRSGIMDDRTTPLVLFIGPEGGFTDQEIQQAQQGGAQILSLGARRLRSETASIVALARVTG